MTQSFHWVQASDEDKEAAVRCKLLDGIALQKKQTFYEFHETKGREGVLDFPAILAALIENDYRGLVAVELSRDSHRAHELVPRSIKALQAYEAEARAQLGEGGVESLPTVAAAFPSSSKTKYC